jgi:hypothetical protein
MIINPYVYASAGLLLDNYTNITAAFSIRKLRTAYTGYCLIARRTVGATTVTANVSFDTNNTISLDSGIVVATGTSAATNLGQFCAATGYSNPDGIAANQSILVSQWYDQSANANHFTQTTAVWQPRLINAGVIETISGVGGSKTTLVSSHANPVWLQRASAITSQTIFSVAKIDTANSINGFMGNVGTTNVFCFYDGTITNYNGIGANDGTNIRSLTGGDLNSHIAYLNIRSSNLYGARDGNAESLIGTFAVANMSNRAIFSTATNGSTSNTLRGKMSELILFSDDKSADLSAIRTNINNYYAIY